MIMVMKMMKLCDNVVDDDDDDDDDADDDDYGDDDDDDENVCGEHQLGESWARVGHGQPAATRPDASDNSMTEATSMPGVATGVVAGRMRICQKRKELLKWIFSLLRICQKTNCCLEWL